MITKEDMVKYHAAKLRETADWTLDILSDTSNEDDDTAVGALSDDIRNLCDIVRSIGSLNHYSDGRVIVTRQWIIPDRLGTAHVWHPIYEEPESWSSNLPHDPGTPSPGKYRVTTDPDNQQINIQILRSAS